jgi:hypothetical protein
VKATLPSLTIVFGKPRVLPNRGPLFNFCRPLLTVAMNALDRFNATKPLGATTLIRIMVGGIFFSEGIQRFLFPDADGVARFAKIGIPHPEIMALKQKKLSSQLLCLELEAGWVRGSAQSIISAAPPTKTPTE